MADCREFFDAPQNEAPVRGFLHQPAHSAGDCLDPDAWRGDELRLSASGDTGRCILRLRVDRPSLRSAFPSVAARTGHRNVAVRTVTSRAPRSSCFHATTNVRAACFWAVTLTEEGRRRCWPPLSPISSIDYCCSRTRSTRRNDPVIFGQRHFAILQTPAMFVHGTRDGFGSIDEVVRGVETHPGTNRIASYHGCGSRTGVEAES